MKKFKIIELSFAIGIAILLNIFIPYVGNYFFPEPEYNDFCSEREDKLMRAPVNDSQISEETCLQNDGEWINYATTVETEPQGYCDFYSKCNGEYEVARDAYSQNAFIFYLLIAIVLLIISQFLIKNQVVASSLAAGSILLMIISSMRFWSSSDELIRIIILGIALFVLIYLAYKKFNNED